MNVDIIIDKIISSNSKIIAFDIFDTLVERLVPPEYTKKLWAKSLVEYLNLEISSDELYRMRADAEAVLCKKSHSFGDDLEFKYNEMCLYILSDLSIKIEEERFIEICIQQEISTELRVLNVKPKVLELLDKLYNHNYTIVCISDFYLSKEAISNIFDELGLNNYILNYWISCDFLQNKRSGRLYDIVLKELNIKPNELFMIGDNKFSDYEMAKSKGIHGCWVSADDKHVWYKSEFKKARNTDYVKKTILQLTQKGVSDFSNTAFSLYEFIDSLYISLKKDGHRTVFFLSREGEYLKILFDLYQEINKLSKIDRIKSEYLIVSRKSTFLPSLKELCNENFEVLFRQYRKISIYDFLNSLNFSDNSINNIENLLDIDIHIKSDDLPTDNNFKKLLDLQYFKEVYEYERLEQNKFFKEYLESFNFDWRVNTLALVDVGWKGTIQDNIFNILSGTKGIDGYYVGLVPQATITEYNKKKGVLFYNNLNSSSANFSIYNVNRSIFEMLLGASHGSANKYSKVNNSIVVEMIQQKEEEIFYNDVIKPIQNKILIIFTNITEKFAFSTIEPTMYSKIVTQIHAKMVLFPSKKEMDFFRKMYHYENFGVFEFTKFKFYKCDIKTRIANFIKFIKSPNSILDLGFWVPLTLDDQGLGFLKWFYGVYKLYRYNKFYKN